MLTGVTHMRFVIQLIWNNKQARLRALVRILSVLVWIRLKYGRFNTAVIQKVFSKAT
jgi:hypothetical protein